VRVFRHRPVLVHRDEAEIGIDLPLGPVVLVMNLNIAGLRAGRLAEKLVNVLEGRRLPRPHLDQSGLAAAGEISRPVPPTD
jgi:hypothetical protein